MLSSTTKELVRVAKDLHIMSTRLTKVFPTSISLSPTHILIHPRADLVEFRIALSYRRSERSRNGEQPWQSHRTMLQMQFGAI